MNKAGARDSPHKHKRARARTHTEKNGKGQMVVSNFPYMKDAFFPLHLHNVDKMRRVFFVVVVVALT